MVHGELGPSRILFSQREEWVLAGGLVSLCH